jgi:hypothetical protein
MPTLQDLLYKNRIFIAFPVNQLHTSSVFICEQFHPVPHLPQMFRRVKHAVNSSFPAIKSKWRIGDSNP